MKAMLKVAVMGVRKLYAADPTGKQVEPCIGAAVIVCPLSFEGRPHPPLPVFTSFEVELAHADEWRALAGKTVEIDITVRQ